LLIVSGGKVSDADAANICMDNQACLTMNGFDSAKARNDQGKLYSTLSYVSGGVLAVGGTMLVVGLIKGFVVGGSKETRVSSKARRGRTEMVVAPVVTDRSAGATLHFRW
jgi:hypothetical protein